MSFEPKELNVYLFYLINHNNHPYLDLFFQYFRLLGKGWVLLLAFLVVLLFQGERLKLFLLLFFIESLTVNLLKIVFSAPRPAKVLQDVHLLEPLYHKSFPSGDTAMAFALATFFSSGAPLWLKPLLWVYALLIGYGRVYVGAHFPFDVVVGALIGTLSYFVAHRLLKLVE
ncbi:MAG: phosphatase PAP2 family protein [Aquificota bacterium]|nr:MAG: phosphatase PAP2 family protein [Aquificota bacterium]